MSSSRAEFLAHLKQLDIQLWIEGDKLRYSAPPGVMNDHLKAEIIQRKPEILAFLKEVKRMSGRVLPKRQRKEHHFPLSFAQQRLWFLEQLQPGQPTYHIVSAVRLEGSLDIFAMEQAVQTLVQRHEALRTHFKMVKGELQQIVDEPQEKALIQIDRLEEKSWPEIQAFIQEEARHPFDLEAGPLLRVRAIQLNPTQHILLVVTHHIISDGWSEEIFFRELGILYGNFHNEDRNMPLPPLPIQYPDFAAWQREWFRGEILEEHLQYWRKQLGGNLPTLQLPTDYPRPPRQTFTGATYSSKLSPSLTQAIRTFSRQEGVTLFMTLVAAFKLLLYRYSGQTDILIGTPIAHRNRSEIEPLIGFFVNTLVLRTDLSGQPTFRNLLKRIREVALDAYAHQDLPFEQLVESLQPERDLSRHPLFQVMFALEESFWADIEFPGLTLEPLKITTETAKFDLTLFVEDKGQEFVCLWEYNTDLFEAKTIERMMNHFQKLLEGSIQDGSPARPITEIPLLTEAEHHQLFVSWNDTAAPYPDHLCVHHLFEAQAEKTPQAIAVSFKDQTLTYAELNQRANYLAHQLQRLGVGPETIVGLYLSRSLEMMIALWGILKAGGAYLPLDPSYPPERLAFMLEEAEVAILLSEATLQKQLPVTDHEIQTLWLDHLPDEQEPSAPNSETHPDNLAYIIYTSGSTGRPKGVMIPHRGLVNYLSWAKKAYRVADGTGAPVHSSLSFDLTITGLFLPLLCGKQVVLLPDDDQGAQLLSETLREGENFSLVKITPAHLELLNQQLPKEQLADRTRALVIGGEALKAETLSLWRTYAPNTRLINEYGPTETVVGCSIYEVSSEDPTEGTILIGRPIANTELFILDEYQHPVPVGVAGELYIGGHGVARGYLKRPDLTTERFLPHPVRAGARIYKTGDRACYLPDGNIRFLGRQDHQVKIRGFRIELGEIEAVLQQHPQVQEAIVLDREDDPRLVAYIVPDSPSHLPDNLPFRSYLAKKLPEYMIPTIFVPLETFPLTPNGKIDREALPAPFSSNHVHTRQDYLAPRNPLEFQLSQIWEKLLGIQPVGVTDDFFRLGGHSLLAIRLTAQIEQQFDQKIPLSALFQGRTIEHLAKVLQEHTTKTDFSVSGPLVEIQSIQQKGIPPFFCVHPANGQIFSYLELAHHLDSQPFYGLQSSEFNHHRLEEMSRYYIEALQTVQTEGPYLLGGWSMGGVIAFEMAQQLRQTGKEVALLALLDSVAPAPNSGPTSDDEDEQLLIQFLQDLHGRLGTQAPPIPDDFNQFRTENKLEYVLEQARMLEKILPEGGFSLSQLHHLLQIFKANIQALKAYEPHPYGGQIILFQSQEAPEKLSGWEPLSTQPIIIHSVPGTHYTMMNPPHIQIIAEQLKKYFAQVNEVKK